MPDFDDRKKKAFDLVVDTTKLLITLSTAILGFLVSGILSGKDESLLALALKAHRNTTKWGLIFLVACVFFCIFTILRIIGLLSSDNLKHANKPSPYDGMTRLTFILGFLCFFGGVLLLGMLSFRVLGA